MGSLCQMSSENRMNQAIQDRVLPGLNRQLSGRRIEKVCLDDCDGSGIVSLEIYLDNGQRIGPIRVGEYTDDQDSLDGFTIQGGLISEKEILGAYNAKGWRGHL